MHAKLYQSVGPKLQQRMRRSPSEVSASRAELILRSGLGDSVEQLAADYDMAPEAIRALIVDFNVRGMKALSRKPLSGDSMQMTQQDQRIVDEMIRLTPQAFDRPDI